MEQQFWQSRYEQSQTGWNIGDVSTPIKAYLDQLTDKNIKILIPGCGFGYEAIYAHELGFKNVYVLDFVSEALQQLKINCPTFPSEHILQADFFQIEGEYDLIIEQTLFCAINPNQRENYAKQVDRILKKGGALWLDTPDIEACGTDFWNDPTHVHPYTRNSFRVLLEMNGFVEVMISPNYRCKTINHYRGTKLNFYKARKLMLFRGTSRLPVPDFFKGKCTGLFALSIKPN
jgi:SAM-dependent methyltransferase